MLTQRQLVSTIRVQLFTPKGPLSTTGQDSNSLLPLPQFLPLGERIIKEMALELAGIKSPVVWVSPPVGE